MEPKNDSQFSRRDLFKLGGLVIGSVAAGTRLGRWLGLDVDLKKQTPEERLTANGLEDFIPLHLSINDLWTTYGINFNSDHSKMDFFGAVDKASRFADQSTALVDKLNKGWASEHSPTDLAQAAQKKAAEINIAGLENTTAETAAVRGGYNKLAQLFPALVLGGPTTLEVLEAGGGIGGNTLYIVSPHKDRVGFFVGGVHELGHIGDDPEKIKPYTDKIKFLAYTTEQVHQIKKVLDNYFSLDWEQAKAFKHGSPLIQPGEGINTGRLWQMAHGQLSEKIITQLPAEEIFNNKELLFNWLIHAAGKHCLSQPYANNYQNHDLAKSNDLQYLLGAAVKELLHYFVGPSPFLF